MTCGIEPLLPGAAKPLAVMHRACFPDDPWDAAALDRIFGLSGMFAYLGWQDHDPAGFILARDLGDEVEILSLGVLPMRRHRGLGRGLLDAALVEASRRGCRSVVLEVAEENASARRLYKSCGFVEVGRRPRYYRWGGRVVDGLILRRAMEIQSADE